MSSTVPPVSSISSFVLDPFQTEAIAAVERGRSVLVLAPTGAGKTVVSDHAVDRVLARGERAFVTTPLRALCNQKYRDLGVRLGLDRVGLITGDLTRRRDADVVVMTTEVVRAMLAEPDAAALAGVGVVVLDEFHFLEDPERGPVWEEVVVHLDPRVQLVCLSATMGDADIVGRWLEEAHGPTDVIVEDTRPVPLHHVYAIGTPQQRLPPELFPLLDGDQLHPIAALRDGTRARTRGEGRRSRERDRPAPPTAEGLLEVLRRGHQLPAIWFVLSRRGCESMVDTLTDADVVLTSPEDAAELGRRADAALARLPSLDAQALGSERWRSALTRGIATHHGGLTPIQRETVELAFADGLLRLVVATETLAVGVNLPARSVIIDRVTRPGGQGRDTVTPNEFAQLAGRAGRRGMDRAGHVVVPWSPAVDAQRVAAIATAQTREVRSHLAPTPALVATLVHRYGLTGGRDALTRTLGHRLEGRAAALLRADVEARQADLDAADAAAPPDERPSPSPALGVSSADTTPSAVASVAPGVSTAIETLRPGDVVVDPARPALSVAVVVAPPRARRGQPAVDVVAPSGRHHVATAKTFRQPPAVIGQLPADGFDRSRGQARAAARALEDALRTRAIVVPQPSAATQQGDGQASPAHQSDRAALSSRRARERLAAATECWAAADGALQHDYDAMVDVLTARGHLDGGTVTESGHAVRRIYHPRGLLLAECLTRGLLSNLTVDEAVATIVVFRPSSSDPDAAIAPRGTVRERLLAAVELARQIDTALLGQGLEPIGRPELIEAVALRRWAAGAPLGEALAGTDWSAGQLVREARITAELADQLARCCRETRNVDDAEAFTTAASTLRRSVVMASAYDAPAPTKLTHPRTVP